MLGEDWISTCPPPLLPQRNHQLQAEAALCPLSSQGTCVQVMPCLWGHRWVWGPEYREWLLWEPVTLVPRGWGLLLCISEAMEVGNLHPSPYPVLETGCMSPAPPGAAPRPASGCSWLLQGLWRFPFSCGMPTNTGHCTSCRCSPSALSTCPSLSARGHFLGLCSAASTERPNRCGLEGRHGAFCPDCHPCVTMCPLDLICMQLAAGGDCSQLSCPGHSMMPSA